MKPSEHKFLLRRDRKDERDLMFQGVFPGRKVPPKVDLRGDCPPIRDQGNLGACTAFAGVAAEQMREGHLQSADALSTLFLYYQERLLYGTQYLNVDCGAEMRDIPKALNKAGACLEQYMPYNERQFNHAPSEAAYLDARNHKCGSYSRLQNLAQVKVYLGVHERPVLAGLDCYESFVSDEVAATGIVPVPKPGEEILGGHAILLVGYDDENKVVIARNSWGTNWGKEGYFIFPYQMIEDDIVYDFWVIQ